MREALAQAMEACGFGLLVAGVWMTVGLGVALIVAGLGLAVTGAVVSR